jgi:hypothetical protein
MDRREFLLGSLVVAGGGLVATEAQADTWYSFGEKRVSGLADFDQWNIGRDEGGFNAIRFRVRGNDLMVYDVNVKYGNGADDDIPVRFLIPEGGQTRIIDLRAGDRFIRWVRVFYGKAFNLRGPTWVELLARKG